MDFENKNSIKAERAQEKYNKRKRTATTVVNTGQFKS